MPTEIPFPDPLGILEAEARAAGRRSSLPTLCSWPAAAGWAGGAATLRMGAGTSILGAKVMGTEISTWVGTGGATLCRRPGVSSCSNCPFTGSPMARGGWDDSARGGSRKTGSGAQGTGTPTGRKAWA